MLKHYLDLMRQFRMIILAGVIGTGALACGLSLLLLQAMPIYKSRVVLNMKPSDEALMFNRAFMGVTQFSPAVIITQTHIERLLSRRVAERALDILIEESGGSLPTEPPNALAQLKAKLWRTWNMANYGIFIPAPPRESLISDIQSATNVEIVEGSYIMAIEISYNDPVLAARAANALAQAFIESASLDFSEDAIGVDKALDTLQSQKNAELTQYIEERRSLQRQLASENVDDGRMLLSAERIATTKKLTDAERVLERLQSELAQPSSVEQAAIANLNAQVIEAEDLVSQLALALESNEAELRSLDRTETALRELDLQIQETESDLEELRARRLSTSLAREARMNQVEIISDARVPTYPAFPKVIVNTIVGTILGGILLLAPIAILDVMNNRIRTSEDLRQAVAVRALPTVTQKMAAQARRYLKNGKAPGRELKEFGEMMSRRLLTEGHKNWPEQYIYVTAIGSKEHVTAMQDVVKAAASLFAPRTDASPLAVVALPQVARLPSWEPYQGGTILVGVAAGEAESTEIERMSGSELAQGAEAYFAVVL